MMSVIADPADPMSPALWPEDPHPVGTEGPPPGDTMPIVGPDADESESQPTE